MKINYLKDNAAVPGAGGNKLSSVYEVILGTGEMALSRKYP